MSNSNCYNALLGEGVEFLIIEESHTGAVSIVFGGPRVGAILDLISRQAHHLGFNRIDTPWVVARTEKRDLVLENKSQIRGFSLLLTIKVYHKGSPVENLKPLNRIAKLLDDQRPYNVTRGPTWGGGDPFITGGVS